MSEVKGIYNYKGRERREILDRFKAMLKSVQSMEESLECLIADLESTDISPLTDADQPDLSKPSLR